MDPVFYLVATALLVFANAFFVAAEFALVKVRPTRLEQLVREGNGRARLALRMTQNLGPYLSANQLGITLASLALGWIGEPAIADLIQPWFASLGGWAGPSAHGIALGIALFIVTALHTVIGEQAPKAFAIQRAESIALNTALPLRAFYLVMWPVIRTLNAAANGFARLCGLQAGGHELAHTSEELRMLLTQTPVAIDRSVRSVLVRMLDQRRRTARHVMTLRSDIETLDAGVSIERAVEIANETGYSRYPVLGDGGGKVLGYIHLRDLFEVISKKRRAVRVAEILRAPIFTREGTSVERLRLEMQAKRVPFAIVTSASGEFVGVVTLEDLLEEIVGEIRDENDEEVPPIHRRGGGIVEVDGRLFLSDLERDANIVLRPPVESAETVAGYVLARLGRPAASGETVECEGYTVVALDVAGRRLRRIRIVAAGSIAPGPTKEPVGGS